MKPETQRIKIAEACGWTTNKRGNWVTPDFRCVSEIWGPHAIGAFPPDYINDLNAMHEAEKSLNVKQIRNYAFTLAIVLDTCPSVDLDEQFLNIHATAAQRAEAFLRTLGKWEDEE